MWAFPSSQLLDLDSMTSSILYAFLRSLSPPIDAFSIPYIPVLNVLAADVGLRPEFALTLKHAGIKPSDLITIDDLPAFDRLSNEMPAGRTRWILVDHNKLEGSLGKTYQHRVHGVIDHHLEENSVLELTDPEPRVVETCGSCTSLVLHHLALKGDQKPTLPYQAAKLGLASILIDTRNLQDENKVRPIDVSTVGSLETIIRTEDQSWDRQTFFDDLDKVKKDVDHLPLQGILRKDYKEWTEAGMKLGMSTVIKPLSFLIEKAQEDGEDGEDGDKGDSSWDKAASTFMRQRNLRIWAIMTTVVVPESDGWKLTRELYLQWSDGEGEVNAVKRFEEIGQSELRLEAKDVPDVLKHRSQGWNRKAWRQMDVTKSRKEVGPMLRRAMQQSIS